MEYSVGNTLLLYRGVIILQDCSKVVVWVCHNGFKWISCPHLGIWWCHSLMQSGKEYVNLSPALQDAYTAWTTLQLLDRFILLQTFPHCWLSF
jgi:hypothetical protein